MNKLNELMYILQEECDGLQHICSKIIRYGDSNQNLDDLEKAIGSILAMIKLVDEDVKLNQDALLSYADDKTIDVERYFDKNKKNKK